MPFHSEKHFVLIRLGGVKQWKSNLTLRFSALVEKNLTHRLEGKDGKELLQLLLVWIALKRFPARQNVKSSKRTTLAGGTMKILLLFGTLLSGMIFGYITRVLLERANRNLE